MNIHGGNILAMANELGCKVEELIDMSSNLTPFGMVPGLRERIERDLVEISYLPETDSETLRGIFAGKYGLGEDEILVGNGTTEFIFALPGAFAQKRAVQKRAVIVNPTYSDYKLACEWAGVEAESFMLTLDEDFVLDLDKLSFRLQGGELVFICNPNNPTGAVIPNVDLYRFIIDHPDTYFQVDESYLPFTREKSLLYYELPDNLFILCSSSKIYGIPGLRLGFLVARATNLQKLTGQRKPWGVNRIAQIAGEYLLGNADKYVEEVVRFVEVERPEFTRRLQEIKNVRAIPGQCNFILCYLEDDILAPELREKLLEKRIMVRNCVTFDGLNDHYFRMSLKSKEENAHCLDVLQSVLS